MPESASEQLKLTVTSALYQPLPFGARSGEASITGAVRSILIPPTDALRELPALSETETSPVPRSSPWPVTMESSGTVVGSTPESASLADQWTVTSSLYQPLPFGSVVAAPERLG